MAFGFSQVTHVSSEATENCESGRFVRYGGRHRVIPNSEFAIESAPLMPKTDGWSSANRTAQRLRTGRRAPLIVVAARLDARFVLDAKTDPQFLCRPCAAIVQRARLGSDTPRPQPLALKSDAVRREADARASEPCR
jgi:hypothetical protein